jgi:MFS transporter, OFA family, oxalate/formate antiporter
VANLIGNHKSYGTAYTTIAIIALVAMILPLITKIPRKRQTVSEGYLGEVAGETA